MGPSGPTSSPTLSYGRTQSSAPHDGRHHTSHWELDLVAPLSHSPFTITLRQSQVVGSVPLGHAIPTPPSGLDVPRPLDQPSSQTGPPDCVGPWDPSHHTAGTRVELTKGNVIASFALDGPVASSAPLSQIRRCQPSVPLCNYPISLTSLSNSYGIYTPPTLPSLALTAFPSVPAHSSHNQPVGVRVDPPPIARVGRHFLETTDGRRSRSKGMPWDKRDPRLSCRNPT